MAPDPGWLADAAGFLAAIEASAARIELPRDRPRPVLLPSYRGTHGQPNLTALIALLLQRYGVPVLVHGAVRPGPGGTADAPSNDAGTDAMLTSDVLWELGIEPAAHRADAGARLLREGLAFVPGDVLAPGLAAYAAARAATTDRALLSGVTGLVDPFGGDGFRVFAIADEPTLADVRAHLGVTRGNALLFGGTEGEPFADPHRQPRLEHVTRGVVTVCAEAEAAGAGGELSLSRTADAAATAAWITQALAGSVPLPPPIVTQLGCCLNGARRLTAAAVAKPAPA